MDYKLLFDVAVLAGEAMAKNGAETYRVEETVECILKISKLKKIEVFVTMTGFCVTLDHPTMDSMTVVKRIKSREMNLGRVHEVNNLSRSLCKEEISLEEALKILKKINREEAKPNAVPMIMISAAFAIMFGGGWEEVVVAFFAGLASAIILQAVAKVNMHMFLVNIICTTSIAVTVNLFQFIFGNNYNIDITIIAAIMPFVPGIAVTNAVFDTLNGDYLSGLARAAEAFVIAVSVAIGIGFGMGLFRFILGGML